MTHQRPVPRTLSDILKRLKQPGPSNAPARPLMSPEALAQTKAPITDPKALFQGVNIRPPSKKGLQAQDFRQGNIDNLIAEINKGNPTAVLLDFGSIQTAHYVVVVGYNLERQSLILHDSIEAPYFEMPLSTFEKMWENKAIRSILPVAAQNYQRLMFKVSKQTP